MPSEEATKATARGLDYYECLGLTRNADVLEIRRTFRRLALKYHPDCNKDVDSKEEFARICEAYDVLSDPKRKGFYDLYGEHGLKDGEMDAQGGLKGGIYQFDPELGPHQVFARFFGTSNPYEALDAISAQFEAMTTQDPPKKGKNKVYTVELTLEEIYFGCLKKVTHKRKVLHENGECTEEQRTLTIDVKSGLPSGTRFVFEGEGNKVPKKEPGFVVFVLKPLPHDRFLRRGSDLVHKLTLPLYQALIGTSVDVQTLDHRTLSIPIADVVTPGYKRVVPGEGMPKPTGGKGDLILEVELLFPTHITETQKMLIKSAFFLPGAPSKEQHKALRQYEQAFKDPLHGWATNLPKEEGLPQQQQPQKQH
ncbi:radial spoke protein 16 [Dunaliella salina]|uniref:Radial spoke protein 16 n=1 Tax=Dunaliella salina TaxID=3046 RepID=A0ABQ7GBP5_DUNSA|nr:radial spoke protein 16 [Dunaliella salina]|eukprot:KAF5832029.1 radial spoke protein 16 [Dunaliella salina]